MSCCILIFKVLCRSELFQETLKFAHEAGAKFNGVLCGRATWSGAVQVYIEQGEDAARES
jgi:tagatose 1,6-diphosphate aldolase